MLRRVCALARTACCSSVVTNSRLFFCRSTAGTTVPVVRNLMICDIIPSACTRYKPVPRTANRSPSTLSVVGVKALRADCFCCGHGTPATAVKADVRDSLLGAAAGTALLMIRESTACWVCAPASTAGFVGIARHTSTEHRILVLVPCSVPNALARTSIKDKDCNA